MDYIKKKKSLPMKTASETLLMLNQPAFVRVVLASFELRKFEEPLDPELMTTFGHAILELASEADRAEQRKTRIAAQ